MRARRTVHSISAAFGVGLAVVAIVSLVVSIAAFRLDPRTADTRHSSASALR